MPDEKKLPLTKQPVLQLLLKQNWPVPPQESPVFLLVQLLMLVPGRQTSQAFPGFAVLLPKNWPPMKQPSLHAPDEHTRLPPPHVFPFETEVQLVVELPGWQD